MKNVVKSKISYIFLMLVLLITLGAEKESAYAQQILTADLVQEEAVEDQAAETDVKELSGEKSEEDLTQEEGWMPEIAAFEVYDKYISLTVGMSEEIEFSENETFFYEVKVLLKKEEEEKEKIFLFEKEDSTVQDIYIEMQEGSMGEEETWTCSIEVKLIRGLEDEKWDFYAAEDTGWESRTCVLSNIEVRPYYESKLVLKQKAKSICTTQKNVALASVKFNSLTTERDNLFIEDITYNKDGDSHKAVTLRYDKETYTLYADAGEDTALGKHLIRVTADAPEGTQGCWADITVNVLQGIEEGMLAVRIPSDYYYKAEGKGVSFTAKAVFSPDGQSQAEANRKKIKWEILSADKEPLMEGSPLYGFIRIKNGKVSIGKKFVSSQDPSENRFVIKVSADDFSGNEVCVYSEIIEIGSMVTEIGEAVILKMEEDGSGVVTARSRSSVTAEQLGKIVLFKKDAPVKESYTRKELEEYTFKAENLSYTSADRSIKIEKDGTILASKPVKNVKITVSLNDNTKQKAILKNLSVVYKQPMQIGFRIDRTDENGLVISEGRVIEEDTLYEMDSYTDAGFKVTIMQKADQDSKWEEADSYINHVLKAENASIIKKTGKYNQYYELSFHKKQAVIKLTDRTNEKTIICTIKNNAYPEGKTPKLSWKGSLKAAAYEKDQSIVCTLKKNGAFEYDPYKKYYAVAADRTEKYKNDKNIASYEAFEEAMGGFGIYPVINNQIVLEFHSDKENPLPAGKYKLWFTLGKRDDHGDFLPDTKMMSVSVSVKKVKTEKGSYKAVGKYDISIKEGGIVTLKGTGKNYQESSIEYTELKNANVDGTPNDFTTYFEVDGKKIRLKENLSEEQLEHICGEEGKRDLQGYIRYQVLLNNGDGSFSDSRNISKVTLTLKESIRKYTIKKVNTNSFKLTLTTKVYADSKAVNILYAYAAGGTYTVEAEGTEKLTLTPKSGNDKPKGGTNNITVYLIPQETHGIILKKTERLKKAWEDAQKAAEKATIAELAAKKEAAAKAEEQYKKAMKKYGIKVTAKVILPTREIENREYVKQVVSLVNKERSKQGLGALAMDEDINYAAYIRSKEIVNLFSHDRPDGTPCYTVLNQYDIPFWSAGENIAMGQRSPEEVVNAWMNSPGHRANILDGGYTHIGVGCYRVNGYYHWVQLFVGR